MERAVIRSLGKKEGVLYASLDAAELGRKVKSAEYMGGGSFGRAYRIDFEDGKGYAVIKLFVTDGLCESEALGLRALRESTSMRVPEVYFTRRADDKVPADCLCMEFIEGVNALKPIFLFYPKRKKRFFAEAVVDAMLEYHTTTHPKFGPLKNPVCDSWLDYYRPFAEEVLLTAQKLRGQKMLDDDIVNTMEAAWEKFNSIFAEPVLRPALLHGDLNVMNIMVEPKSFSPVAFIDPLNAMYGDREFDLFQLNNLTGKAFGLYDLYKSRYPVSKNCDIKCAFYGLWNEVHVFIKTGTLVKFIMNPLVKNMKMQLAAADFANK